MSHCRILDSPPSKQTTLDLGGAKQVVAAPSLVRKSNARFWSNDRIIGVCKTTGWITVWDAKSEKLVEHVFPVEFADCKICLQNNDAELIGNVLINDSFNEDGSILGVAIADDRIDGQGLRLNPLGPWYVNLDCEGEHGGIGVFMGTSGKISTRRPNANLYHPESNEVIGETRSIAIRQATCATGRAYWLVQLEQYRFWDNQFGGSLNLTTVDTFSGKAVDCIAFPTSPEIDAVALAPTAPFRVAAASDVRFAVFEPEVNPRNNQNTWHSLDIKRSECVTLLSFSSDGSRLAICSSGGAIDVRQVDTCERVCNMKLPPELVDSWWNPASVEFSPDGTQLLIASDPGFLLVDIEA